MEHSNTLRQFKQRVEESNKQKTKKQKRQEKINKLSSLDKHWKGLEYIDHSQLNEDIAGFNKAYMNFRSLYQPGGKVSCKEWIGIMGEVLDEIDYRRRSHDIIKGHSIKQDEENHCRINNFNGSGICCRTKIK